jgi:hypothetical protein
MNPLAKLQLQKDQKDLSTTALEVERLLRKAGDLTEKMPRANLGYLFLSGLDQVNLTIYLIGTPELLTDMLVESGSRKPELAACILAAAAKLQA